MHFSASFDAHCAVLRVEGELQSGTWPAHLVQAAGARASDPRITHVGTAEADIGRYGIRERDVLARTGGLEQRYAAVPQRAHADAPTRFNGEAVEPLKTRQRAHHTP